MSTAQPAAPAATGFTHRQILVILGGLMSGMFLAALDMTIVSTAIRTISDDLQGLSVQAWVTTAYLITSTIATPLYGKLSDLYGRRPFFLLAISLFVVGSVLCGIATSMYQLAAFRAFQGLGAGGLMSLALTIIGDVVPPRERARYQGYILAVFGSSSVLGPVIGGFFAGQDTILGITGWRWVFLVNVPIGLVALAIVFRVLHLPHTRRDHRIDYFGAIALAVGLIPLLIVAEQGRAWGWTSGRVLGLIALGVLGLVAFVAAERRIGDDALLPLRLFGGRTFSIGSLLNFLIGMGMFGGMAAIPLYMQIVKGLSPTNAGLLMLPMMLGVMSGSVISGQVISRTGRYKAFPVTGAALLVLAMVLFTQVSADSSYGYILPVAGLFGLGLGFNMQTLVLAIQNAVPPQDMGVATASATFFRQMGGALGTAVFLSILFSTVAGNIQDRFAALGDDAAFQAALRTAAATNPALRGLAGNGGGSSDALNDSSFIGNLPSVISDPIRAGFSDSVDLVFMVGAIVLAIALVIVFFLPELPLRTQSGIDAQRSAAAERDAELAAEQEARTVPAAMAGSAPGGTDAVAAAIDSATPAAGIPRQPGGAPAAQQ